jgi:hypothetical protein
VNGVRSAGQARLVRVGGGVADAFPQALLVLRAGSRAFGELGLGHARMEIRVGGRHGLQGEGEQERHGGSVRS